MLDGFAAALAEAADATKIPAGKALAVDREEFSTGIDARMVALLNDADHPFWLSPLALSPHMQVAIRAGLPIKHFRELRRMAGVGKSTYEKIHRYLYARVVREGEGNCSVFPFAPPPEGGGEDGKRAEACSSINTARAL